MHVERRINVIPVLEPLSGAYLAFDGLLHALLTRYVATVKYRDEQQVLFSISS